MIGARPPLTVQCGAAGFVMPGYATSGDLEVVVACGDLVLLALMDGIGHGTEAAAAARSARQVILAHAHESVVTIVRLCHEALRATRGVVMSLAAIDAGRGSLSWIGVGNVRGTLCRFAADAADPRHELLLRPGVIGAALPTLQSANLPVKKRDTLIFVTDGIGADPIAGPCDASRSPQVLATDILMHHCRGDDDALVLVARLC